MWQEYGRTELCLENHIPSPEFHVVIDRRYFLSSSRISRESQHLSCLDPRVLELKVF